MFWVEVVVVNKKIYKIITLIISLSIELSQSSTPNKFSQTLKEIRSQQIPPCNPV